MVVCRSFLLHFSPIARGIENVIDEFPFLSCVRIQSYLLELLSISYPSHFLHVHWRNNCRHANDFQTFKLPVSHHSFFFSIFTVTQYAEFFELSYLTWHVLNSVSLVDHNQINFFRKWKSLQHQMQTKFPFICLHSTCFVVHSTECSTYYTWVQTVFENKIL
jgi:hypothetical protein